MKELFPGYYRKTEADIKRIWENGIIMFDTNVLLNLYRYSESTQKIILELIKKFSSQIYLPHQAALEYNRNRYEVIAEQEKAYNEFLDKIIQIQKDLQSTSKPPFLTNKVDKELNSVFEKVTSEVKESIDKYCDYLKNDPIYNSISELFENRITNQFTPEELSQIFKEGEERFKNKIPPGFEDEKTKEGNRKYGDLILWKQIIIKAKELKKDVILITDERKIDWWWKIKDGRNMGPRQELVEEIKREANVDFHMYSSERFLTYGQSLLKEKINQQAFEEIQAMKKAEMEEIRRIQILEKKRFEREIKANEELHFLFKKLDAINQKINNLRVHRDSLFKDSLESNEVQEYIHNTGILHSELEEEKVEIMERIDSIKNLINDTKSENNEKLKYLKYYNEFKNRKG
ncbi:PIN-like domain-containing protein [Runella limosa]|uniref:PIN-like domain-containing protein n=1 Tax=Runella limosa TaxID=370978 RepID=UPI00048A4A1A|nr:PIN-like domain-containing protein [Runella limosa]